MSVMASLTLLDELLLAPTEVCLAEIGNIVQVSPVLNGFQRSAFRFNCNLPKSNHSRYCVLLSHSFDDHGVIDGKSYFSPLLMSFLRNMHMTVLQLHRFLLRGAYMTHKFRVTHAVD